MQIAYTLTSFPPATGGAQQHFFEIARRLAPQHDVRVIRQWNHNRQDWLLGSTVLAPHALASEIDGIKVSGISFNHLEKCAMAPALPLYYGWPGLFTPWLSSFFLNKLQDTGLKPDIVHHGRIGRENLGVASLAWARKLGVPFVLTPFHHPRWVGWRYRKYLELYRQADLVLTLTESEKQVLAGLGVRDDRITVIGHGPTVLPHADGDAFRREHGLGDAPVILFLGQKFPYKGFETLLDAAPEVWKAFPNARFVFLGPRTTESEKKFANYAGREKRILELGTVSLAEKCGALAACDIFALPSMQESFGGVYVEAWMYKKPVIGGRIPAIADVIDDGTNGYLIDQNQRECADRIKSLLSDPGLMEAFGGRGYTKAVEKYSWEAIVANVETAYLKVIGSKRSAQ